MSLADRLMGRPASLTHAEALARGGQGVVVYWRPGCPFCQRLALAVRRVAGRAAWVDIWSDDEARAFVRSLNGGDETVPTVVVDGVAHTNPEPAFVRAALRSISA